MERTIYAKYSNERAESFCIRTDIVTDESGEKKVYKYALTKAAEPHIRHIAEAYRMLTAAYVGSGISFCPSETEVSGEDGWQAASSETEVSGEDGWRTAPSETEVSEGDGWRAAPVEAGNTGAKKCRSASPFLTGASLQDVLERMLDCGDTEGIRRILQAYIKRVQQSGGNRPFVPTPEFARVFGEHVPEGAYDSADVSDIDMIFSNIFVGEAAEADLSGAWTVIDYEWTFDFPVPKAFVIYRALYFAWHQVFYKEDVSLAGLLALAKISEEEAAAFRRMEESFQSYMGQGSLPVRNMQRLMGTKIIPVKELLRAAEQGTGAVSGSGSADSAACGRNEKVRVRKLLYHVDRKEYQDGSMVCSGWALAKTWDKRALPVDIRVTDADGGGIPAEIGRRQRQDVAEALKLRSGADAEYGFDCVWLAQPGMTFRIHFSLGNRESIYEG
ncbi:MAG: hypothetical protein J6K53_12065 [Roseburia sp.]|nr:hypothetical protein [Roseburia sp.]